MIDWMGFYGPSTVTVILGTCAYVWISPQAVLGKRKNNKKENDKMGNDKIGND